MGRINGLVTLLCSSDALKPVALFQSERPRADIFRAIVVFLHATFEDMLRSHIPMTTKRWTFCGRTDIDKALTQSNIDPTPFKPLYPPLTEMAKRRTRIVHHADLLSPNRLSLEWHVADDWQLMMWLMTVPAFFCRLRMSVNVASEGERSSYERYNEAMRKHVDFGKQLIAVPGLEPELRTDGMEQLAATLDNIRAILRSTKG